ncbi:MAG: hypothetical protein IVW54_00865 [Candidatus Binataceae bacterium]|nr:hypothetical protein [Candidatus Binataceae bacterium]
MRKPRKLAPVLDHILKRMLKTPPVNPILVASTILLLSAVGVASNEMRPNQHQKSSAEETKSAHRQESEPTAPLSEYQSTQSALLKAIRAIYGQREAAAKETHIEYEPFSAPSNVIEILLLLVGCGYTFFAWKQWSAIREQARIARVTLTANRGALNAARRAAEAATKSADVAERQLRHAERAWIAFEVTELNGTRQIFNRIQKLQPTLREPESSPTVEIVQLRIHYRFNNCGRTPARLINGSVQLICADPFTLPVPPNYPLSEVQESLLPPGNSAVNSLIVQLFPPRFEGFVKNQESLIIFGFIRYRDVIGEGAESTHETRFRMECRFPGYINAPGGDISFAEPLYFFFSGPESYNRYT